MATQMKEYSEVMGELTYAAVYEDSLIPFCLR
jgi:hypothetical protein